MYVGGSSNMALQCGRRIQLWQGIVVEASFIGFLSRKNYDTSLRKSHRLSDCCISAPLHIYQELSICQTRNLSPHIPLSHICYLAINFCIWQMQCTLDMVISFEYLYTHLCYYHCKEQH